MDIGQLRNNTSFYDGYEGEDEVIFELEKDRNLNLHIWVGYLDDILCEPSLSGEGWTGLTRDYHQAEKAFSGSGEGYIVSPDEYLTDIEQYQSRQFDAPESKEVLKLLMLFMKHAIDLKSQIIIRVS